MRLLLELSISRPSRPFKLLFLCTRVVRFSRDIPINCICLPFFYSKPKMFNNFSSLSVGYFLFYCLATSNLCMKHIRERCTYVNRGMTTIVYRRLEEDEGLILWATGIWRVLDYTYTSFDDSQIFALAH